jgi:hypothetical protein
MIVLYYYLFINKGILKSIRENILYSKSVWKVLVNIIYGAISFNAIPLSCSWFLFYLNNWTAMSLVSSGVIENEVILILLKHVLLIFFIDAVGLLIIFLLGIAFLLFLIMERLSFELFDKEQPIEKKRKN